MTAERIDIESAYQRIYDDGWKCEGCPYEVVTRDPYATGDRWYALRECDVPNIENCPEVEKLL